MAQRTLLKEQLREAWTQTVLGPYSDMLINSERGLQVHFCTALLEIFKRDEVERRLFVEPSVVVANGEKRYPDLVICNSQRAIGMVELKYTPRGLPDYEKDFETLAGVTASANQLTISNERFRGAVQPRTFAIAPDAVLCWAAIHSDKPFTIDRTLMKPLGNQYLELRAIASELAVEVI